MRHYNNVQQTDELELVSHALSDIHTLTPCAIRCAPYTYAMRQQTC